MSLRLICWIGHKKSLPFLTEHLEHNFTEPQLKSRNDRHHDHHEDRDHDEVIDRRRTIWSHFLASFGDRLTIDHHRSRALLGRTVLLTHVILRLVFTN